VLKKYLLTLFCSSSRLILKFFNSGKGRLRSFSPIFSNDKILEYLSLTAIGLIEQKTN
jgi:hypothetical protein